ncbi:MAG: pyruvate kinase [Candidatus Saccharicenans sp.]|nr:MAG: pyruvate kinase [Candidatus Aminicenantes bacterium]HEK85288.1 pyruvate kinase [Candidatus Aminicenantes bacterium]
MRPDHFKTKIVVTIGPKSRSPEVIRALVEAGASIFRLNFSYGTYDEHQENIRNIRKVSEETGKEVSILQDLQGPKIRLGEIAGNLVKLNVGQDFVLVEKNVLGDSRQASITSPEILKDIKPGEAIFINDGLIKLKVKETLPGSIVTEVISGGEIGSHQGLNFPQSRLSLKALTEKDKQDLVFGLESGIDLVALSFVRSREDLRHFKEFMKSAGKNVPVVAKIEKWEAVHNLEEIIAEAEAIMVARGDLGVELPVEKVPIIQKKIISLSRANGKPVITATQMLNSMINNPGPTRAEVNDIANAILDGTDAVMLSNETAAGQYPVESVEMMRRIISETEGSDIFRTWLEQTSEPQESSITEAIAFSVKKTAGRVRAKVIITATETGRTASIISKYRPGLPILALTPRKEALRFLNLCWGVYPYLVDQFGSVDEILRQGPKIAAKAGFLRPGEIYMITCGTHTRISGSTNLFKVDVYEG